MMGEAYGFFDAEGDDALINDGVDFARSKSSSGLEILLGKTAVPPQDSELRDVYKFSLDAGLPYVVKVSSPTLENRQAADETIKFFRALSCDTALYPREEHMRAEVVYDDGQGYTSYE